MLDFAALSWFAALTGVILFGLGVAVRWLVTEAFSRAYCKWSGTERRVILAMLPRGLATAVMAFLPASAGIPDTELFPMYAVTVIALSVLFMTGALFAERRRVPDAPAPVPS